MKNLYANETIAKATSEMIASWRGEDEAAIQASAEKWSEAIYEQMRNEYVTMASDEQALATREYRRLTSEETSFYNALAKRLESPMATGVADILPGLPVTIINDVYKNLVQNHPLLNAINFQNVGYSTKLVLNAHTAQNAAWGVIPAAVSQEITSAFKIVDLTLSKLSCYAVLPLDLIRMGATFLDNYVRTVITEAMAVALESAIVTGTGKNMPVGMDKKLDTQAVVTDGVYAAKTAVPVTDFSPASYGALIADNLLTTDGGIKKSSVANLGLICSPTDYYKRIMPATTVLNTAGQYVGGLLPFPTKIIPSAGLTDGTAILGFLDEYMCGIGAPKTGNIEVSDEAQFLADTRVFKTITYVNGRAYDNSSFAVLNISNIDPAFITVKVVEGATGATGATGTTNGAG